MRNSVSAIFLQSQKSHYERTWCTPFEKELRRYFDWEGPPCMCWDGFEKVIWWGRFEKELRRYSDWEGPPCMYWDGFEKVIWWGRFKNVPLFTFEMDLRRFLCLKSEMDLRWIWEGNIPSQIFTNFKVLDNLS